MLVFPPFRTLESTPFGGTLKNLPSIGQTHIFFNLLGVFCPKLRFQMLIFKYFSYFRELFFKFHSDELTEISSEHILVVPR